MWLLLVRCSLFNNLQPPSSLQNKCDYYLFKDDIRPEWEDKNNAKGGRWVIEFERRDKDLLNRSWTYTVSARLAQRCLLTAGGVCSGAWRSLFRCWP